MAAMLSYTRIFVWRTIAVAALGLGLAGIAVPGLPTVPFLILSAWAASRSSPRLERWLLEHPKYGGHIRAWRERGAVPRKAKWLAVLTMFASAIVLQFTAAPAWAKTSVPMGMCIVAVWLWRRPDA